MCAWFNSGKKEYARMLFDKGKIKVFAPQEFPFDPGYQIEADAINLRLHMRAKKFIESIDVVDILDQKRAIASKYEDITIPRDGYVLQPGELLFGQTLETVVIESDRHIGLVFGRRTFAGFGLSVTLDQPKFPAGLPWNFPLQIINNSGVPLRIYPFMVIVQLVLFEFPRHGKREYNKGLYMARVENLIPTLDANEQNRIGDSLTELERIDTASLDKFLRNADVEEQLKVYQRDKEKARGKGHEVIANLKRGIVRLLHEFSIQVAASILGTIAGLIIGGTISAKKGLLIPVLAGLAGAVVFGLLATLITAFWEAARN